MQLDRDAMRGLGKVTGFGLMMAVTMLLFGLAGVWLDGVFHTSPWCTVVLFLLGGGGALAYGIIDFLK